MDELNKVSLYSYLLVILSNYPLAMVLTLGLDLSQFKYVAAFLSINRYGKIKPKWLKFSVVSISASFADLQGSWSRQLE